MNPCRLPRFQASTCESSRFLMAVSGFLSGLVETVCAFEIWDGSGIEAEEFRPWTATKTRQNTHTGASKLLFIPGLYAAVSGFEYFLHAEASFYTRIRL